MNSFLSRCAVLLLSVAGLPSLANAEQAATSLRRPVAMALSSDQSHLHVANRDSGTVSTIDADTLKLLGETTVGQQLADITPVGPKHFLVADNQEHELILLRGKSNELQIEDRLKLSPYPVCVAVSKNAATAYVSSLWSRRISVVKIDKEKSKKPSLRLITTLDLPFAPNKLLLVENEKKLIVADNFAGRFGIVDCRTNQLDTVRTFFAENIRGLGIDPRSKLLAVSHTMLNE